MILRLQAEVQTIALQYYLTIIIQVLVILRLEQAPMHTISKKTHIRMKVLLLLMGVMHRLLHTKMTRKLMLPPEIRL